MSGLRTVTRGDPQWVEVTRDGRTTLRWMRKVIVVTHEPGFYRPVQLPDDPLTWISEWVPPVTTGVNHWEEAPE